MVVVDFLVSYFVDGIKIIIGVDSDLEFVDFLVGWAIGVIFDIINVKVIFDF